MQTSYGIDPSMLDKKEQQQLALMQLEGLGLEHFTMLKEHGIETIAGLATLNQQELSSIIHEKNMRRVRIYLRAAVRHEMERSG